MHVLNTLPVLLFVDILGGGGKRNVCVGGGGREGEMSLRVNSTGALQTETFSHSLPPCL